jgi:glycosyltransferase involved in cell wall biosynthesis
MPSRLRIIVTVDPYIPVPPVLYGGIERVVDFVVRGLIRRGHDVTLVAHPDSTVDAPLIPYGAPPHFTPAARVRELMQVGSAVFRRRNRTDVILSWGRLAALAPVLPLNRVAKVQRYCREVVPWRGVQKAVRIAGDSITFAGASTSVYSELPEYGAAGGRWVTAYDGIDTSLYAPVADVGRDAPLMFLGRLEPRKGAHDAIEIARRAGRELVIAGTIDESPGGPEYFRERIEPHIDNAQIRYVGPADDAMKNELLGSASALLFPTGGKEAFGLVMAEAMACGTPVIAYPTGSVPELIREGVNGFIVSDVTTAAAAVERVGSLDRMAIHADCVARFDAERSVDGFERVLYDAVERARAARAGKP